MDSSGIRKPVGRVRPRWRSIWALLACCVAIEAAWVGTACAQLEPPPPPDESPRAPAGKRDGTHFLLEASVGMALARELGYQGDVVFGAGGRMPGTPLRLYFLTSVASSRFHRDSDLGGRLRFDVFGGLGVRAYVPIVPGFRLYGELLGGVQRASDTVSPVQGRSLHMEGVRPELRAGAGFQVRPERSFALGAGIVYRAFEDPFDLVADDHDLAPLTRWTANATVAVLF